MSARNRHMGCANLSPPRKPCFPGPAYIYILILILIIILIIILILIIINILIIIYIIIISLICWGKSSNCRFCRFPPHGIP